MPKHLTVSLRLLGGNTYQIKSHGFQKHKRHNKQLKMHNGIIWQLYKNISAKDRPSHSL